MIFLFILLLLFLNIFLLTLYLIFFLLPTPPHHSIHNSTHNFTTHNIHNNKTYEHYENDMEDVEEDPLIHVAVVATDLQRAHLLLQSLQHKKGFQIHLLGVNDPWTGFEVKLRNVHQLASSLPPDAILMHVDAFDTVVLSDAHEIRNKFLATQKKLVLSTETNLWPPDSFQNDLKAAYPPSPTRFLYINSGTYLGYAGYIKGMLDSLPEDYICSGFQGQPFSKCDDQRCFHTWYLQQTQTEKQANIHVDYHQEIFHCMHGVSTDDFEIQQDRFFLKETQQTPCVLHGNGNAPSYKTACSLLFPSFDSESQSFQDELKNIYTHHTQHIWDTQLGRKINSAIYNSIL